MKIYHIAALSENNVIGVKGKIPWLIKDDLKRFKEITNGHPIIMGRKTFESLGPHAPLKGRLNIVVSSKQTLYYDGRPLVHQHLHTKRFKDMNGTPLALVSSVEEALAICDAHEVYIIGGGMLYETTMGIADELRLTVVHQDIPNGDAFYPEINLDIWMPSFVEPHDTHTYIDYVKRCG